MVYSCLNLYTPIIKSTMGVLNSNKSSLACTNYCSVFKKEFITAVYGIKRETLGRKMASAFYHVLLSAVVL